MRKLVGLILSMICSFQVQAQSDMILEDDCSLNHIYLGINTGFHNKSYVNFGVDIQSYFYKGKLGFNANYNFFKPALGSKSLSEKIASTSLTPKEGLKNGEDWEMGVVYNLYTKAKTKARKIILTSDGQYAFYTIADVTDANLIGIRGGIGQYRGAFSFDNDYGLNLSNLSKNGAIIDSIYFGNGYTNYVINYFYLGFSGAHIANYKLSKGFPKRRSGKVDYYGDLIFLIRKRIGGIYSPQNNDVYDVSISDKVAQNKMGFRLGFRLRASRYFRPCYGAEAGVIPTINAESGGYRSLKAGHSDIFYARLTLSLSLTHPYKKMTLSE